MKKLGLVGGMGPESTIPYYRGIVYGVQERVGETFFPELSIESVNVFDVLRLCREQRYDELTEYLMRPIGNLTRSGADVIALAANTPHIVFDRLRARSAVPLASIVEATAGEAARLHMSRIGLLGTIFTMKNDFFRKPFQRRNIEIIIPSDEEAAWIDDKIASELELGIINEETRAGLQAITGRMKKEKGIEAVILGCTELPLLIDDATSPVPCLDTMKIHIRRLIDLITEAAPL